MENLETLIEKYLRDCETIKTLDKKTIKAYRIDLTQFCSLRPLAVANAFFNGRYAEQNGRSYLVDC